MLDNHSPAEQPFLLIENRRLARRHAALRVRENDPHPAVLLFYDRGNSRLAAADRHAPAPATKVGQPIEPMDSYGTLKQNRIVASFTDDQSVGVEFLFRHVVGNPPADAEPMALADGVKGDTVMF